MEILDSIKATQEAGGPRVDENARPKADRKFGTALCLSGGGYRAALFHLGAMRCLHDMGILQQVETVSSVSGGSILSAYIAKRLIELGKTGGMSFGDWEQDVSKGFRDFVLNDIRTIPVVEHLAWNWLEPKWRAFHLRRNYRKKLTTILSQGAEREVMLPHLPQHPYFIFCSTDLTFGVNWIFTREEVGDYQVGYREANGWTLAGAVAASSCFPPIFGPLALALKPDEFKKGKYKEKDRAELMSYLYLTDGGVYDNLGLQPVIDNHRTILVSDGGAPFVYFRRAGPFGRLVRYTMVIMNQTAALRKGDYFTGITNKLYDDAYLGLKGGVDAAGAEFLGYPESLGEGIICGIRTDLDRFNKAESCILENHGYYVTHNRISDKAPQLIANTEYKPITPHPEFCSEASVLEGLKNSDKRFSISRLFSRRPAE